MHIFPRDRFAVGGILNPGPLLRDLGAVVGEFNGGLDSENVALGVITAPKLEFEAWNAFTKVEIAGPVTMTGTTNTDWVDVPGARVAATTNDGLLHVHILLRWQDTSATASDYLRQARILVDGMVITQSPQVGLTSYVLGTPDAFQGYLHAHGATPVGPGVHDVRLQIRVLTTESVTVSTDFTNVRLQAREAKR